METTTRGRWLPVIYALTIFLSAFLLFQIQPMVSKAILPWFGGTPAVWTTCLLFFQTLLFAGYAYAHFSNTWLTRKWQAIVHIGVIAAALLLLGLLLGVLPDARQKPSGEADPTRAILALLTITIGLPYFVLSATGPLLQAWFAETCPGRTPYRLYALSNVGSLLALMSYPFLFERTLDLPRQDMWWSSGFIAFGILCAYVAWQVWMFAHDSQQTPRAAEAREATVAESATPESRPRRLHYFLWLFLPAFGSATMLATINHVSTDMPTVSLLLVIPLALYLLTFIIAFDHPRWYRPLLVAALTLVCIYVTAFCSAHVGGHTKLYQSGITGPTMRSIAELLSIPTTDAEGRLAGPRVYIDARVTIAANFLAMFGICFMCHGELARLKPPARYLTAYYLMMSAGGALGGLAVAIVAPHVFTTIFEWNLAIFAAAIAAITLVLNAMVGRAMPRADGRAEPAHAPLSAWVALFVLLVPTSFIILDLVQFLQSSQENIVFEHRNFFGTLTIREQDADEPATRALVLRHGTTIHGSQFQAAHRRREPTSYYAPTSGIGLVLRFFRDNPPPGGLRIGDVGLGTGTLAAYVEKGDFLTFYEINPAVIEMSTSGKWFTYYPDAVARGAKVDCKLGDARIRLEEESGTPKLPRYQVLVLDAFSSDAIPTHLLTLEACRNYLPRISTLANDGVDGALVIHVSNRYLDLSRVVRATAEQLQLPCLEISNDKNPDKLINPADWMILTRNEALLAVLEPYAEPSDGEQDTTVLWTDERSGLFDILR